MERLKTVSLGWVPHPGLHHSVSSRCLVPVSVSSSSAGSLSSSPSPRPQQVPRHGPCLQQVVPIILSPAGTSSQLPSYHCPAPAGTSSWSLLSNPHQVPHPNPHHLVLTLVPTTQSCPQQTPHLAGPAHTPAGKRRGR